MRFWLPSIFSLLFPYSKPHLIGHQVIRDILTKTCSYQVIREKIKSIRSILAPGSTNLPSSLLVWENSKDGLFTYKIAYRSLPATNIKHLGPWDKLWRWKGPQRMKLSNLAWLVRSSLQVRRRNRCYGQNPSCHTCGDTCRDSGMIPTMCSKIAPSALSMWIWFIWPNLMW